MLDWPLIAALAHTGGAAALLIWLTTLLATQTDHAAGFGNATAFLARVDEDGGDDGDDWTCDRREFFDARGHADPAPTDIDRGTTRQP